MSWYVLQYKFDVHVKLLSESSRFVHEQSNMSVNLFPDHFNHHLEFGGPSLYFESFIPLELPLGRSVEHRSTHCES